MLVGYDVPVATNGRTYEESGTLGVAGRSIRRLRRDDAGEWSGYAALIGFLVGPESTAYELWAQTSVAYSPRFVREVERIQTELERAD